MILIYEICENFPAQIKPTIWYILQQWLHTGTLGDLTY